MIALLAFLLTLVIGVFSTIVNGWVLSYLWEWFFIPTVKMLSVNIETGATTGLAFVLPSITAFQGIGIMIVVSFLFQGLLYKLERVYDEVTKKTKSGFKGVLSAAISAALSNILSGLIVLGIAWIWHQFI